MFSGLTIIGTMLSTAVGAVLLALFAWIVGKAIVGWLMKKIEKASALSKLDDTARSFALNAIKTLLYMLVVISVISILGIPMASVIAVLASAGVAVGMAMQGSLSNLAGGIMLMIFHPYKVGDYIVAAGEEGIVKDVALFYTTLLTLDNRKVIIPNGSLMNSNIQNYSAEELRRVDLSFGAAKSEDLDQIQGILLDVMKKNELVLDDPAPFASISGGTNEAMQFTARAWCKGENYWDVYFSLTQEITRALGAAGIKAPAVRILSDK
ncbi:MAG: mechanosensitive ion channel family protein [Firmicutes bacterium]|nr:mechanosensitive ion channel family protein [Bacillota bacterium]